jgi:hypothetical protein
MAGTPPRSDPPGDPDRAAADVGASGLGDPPDSAEDQWTYWVRWPDLDGDEPRGSALPTGDLHVHRVCRVLPSRTAREPGGPDNFEFISGTPRWVLRHTPLVILTVGLVFAISAEFSPSVQGLSSILSVVSPENTLLAAAAVLPWPILVWLLATAGILDGRDLSKALVVYGTGLLLVVGTGFSFLLVSLAEDPSALPDNIVYTSGYLLTLFVGGHLLYEGLLKIESLIVNFGKRDVVKNRAAYEAFVAELNDALHRQFLQDDLATVLPGRLGERVRAFGARRVDLPTSHVFAALFSLQFAAVWAIRDGPQNLDFAVTLAGNTLLNVVIAAATFQFLVLIRYFNLLLNDDFVSEAGERVGLRSEPFHFDGRAGFSDLGRFAIRINVILIVGGLYLVYRLYVQGGRAVGAAGLTGLGDVELLLWTFSYLVPVLAYALAAGAWLYYSYWAMHAKMERDREHHCLRFQGTRKDRDGEVPAVGDPMDAFETGPDWSYIMDTPTWPVNNQRLVSMASGTVSPVLLILPSLL